MWLMMKFVNLLCKCKWCIFSCGGSIGKTLWQQNEKEKQ